MCVCAMPCVCVCWGVVLRLSTAARGVAKLSPLSCHINDRESSQDFVRARGRRHFLGAPVTGWEGERARALSLPLSEAGREDMSQSYVLTGD